MFQKLYVLAFLLLFSAFHSAIASQQSLTGMSNPQFVDLLEYEIQNRAFALKAVAELAEDRQGEPDASVWVAYLKLEQLNQQQYLYAKEKFAMPLQPTYFTKLKVHLAGVAATLCPDTILEVMKDATIVYVDKLKELEQLAAAEDRAFFRYVVEQEIVQEQALIYMMEQKFELAAEAIEQFVQKYQI